MKFNLALKTQYPWNVSGQPELSINSGLVKWTAHFICKNIRAFTDLSSNMERLAV